MSVATGQAAATEPVIEILKRQSFDPLLHTVFRTANTSPVVDVVLTEIRDLRAYPGPGRPDPFALLFRGPLDKALPQSMYVLVAQAEQVFEVFLVPVGMDADGRLYEAVFN